MDLNKLSARGTLTITVLLILATFTIAGIIEKIL